MPKQPNEMRRDLLSTLGLNSFIGAVSSPRAQMFSSHLGQKLVIAGADEKYIQTGAEVEFGKYTFSVKMPVRGTILRVIDRYDTRAVTAEAINYNPEIVVIYEDDETNEIGIFTIPRFCSYHQYFGFEYKFTKNVNLLHRGNKIDKDTIFADSPAIADNGSYKYGKELNIAYMSHPAVSEDGVLICRDVLQHYMYKTYETRVVEFGSKKFGLNIYGTPDNYKAFPDIGEYTRDDGLLMMLRDYDDENYILAPCDQSIYDVMEPDDIFDRGTYVSGRGKVIDIKVYTSSTYVPDQVSDMDTQVRRYIRANNDFHKKIVDEYKRLHRERGKALEITPAFHRQIVESIAISNENLDDKITKLHKKNPIDVYRIEFVVEFENIPREGNKITDISGGKGVICCILEPYEMPVDSHGNRADIIMDPNSIINRMNISRSYEPYVNAATRDVLKNISNRINSVLPTVHIKQKDIYAKKKITDIYHNHPELFREVYNYLMGYYEIVSPKMYQWMAIEAPDEAKLEHLHYVIRNFSHLYMPPENEPEYLDIVKGLESSYRPNYGPVTYIGNSGERRTTKDNVRIGSIYIMLLDKTGENWSAVASGKLQNFGILSKITKNDKHSQPVRNQPVRAIGESEGRIIVGYAGQVALAEMMDRNNNPHTHKEIVWNILAADTPTDIKKIVDRNKLPYGGTKPITIINHVLMCGGIKFVYNRDA